MKLTVDFRKTERGELNFNFRKYIGTSKHYIGIYTYVVNLEVISIVVARDVSKRW